MDDIGTSLRNDAAGIVEAGVRRYFAARHARVQPFVDAHFSVAGTAAVHRAALGWDILRAPLNLSLALPQAGLKAAALLARKAGAPGTAAKLASRRILLRTDVARELEWLMMTELLELPIEQPGRSSRVDALASEILDDPRVTAAIEQTLLAVGHHGDDPAFRLRLNDAMLEYAGTRAAAAEIATGLMTLGAGAITVQKLTPGVATLGPSLAAIMAQQAAIAAFPLGTGLGSVWYGLFPAAPTGAMVLGLTSGLMLAATVFAAFSGLVTDPIQRKLGLHQRRLHKMLTALERQMLDANAPAYSVKDHYVARLLDLFDMLGAAYRLTRI